MPPPPPKTQQLQLPPPSPRDCRTHLGDLKSQLVKRIGSERAQCYFSYLNGLLSRKLSKTEFDKLCLSTIGRENLPLHNQLIYSIFKNACQAKTPPLLGHNHGKNGSRLSSLVLKKSPKAEDLFNSLQNPPSTALIWSNGNVLPQSPRRVRSGTQNRRIKDRPSPIGPNRRAEVNSLVPHDEVVISELNLCDLKRPMQHLQGESAKQPAKRPQIEMFLPHYEGSVHSTGLGGIAALKDMDDGEHHQSDFDSSRGPLQAPLGIPFCSASIGGAQKSLLPIVSTSVDRFSNICDNSELCHTEALKKRMEQIAEAQGLVGVTMDCANLLNNGLDAHLKRLIRSCLDLVGARTGHAPSKQSTSSLLYVKPVNGVCVKNHIQVQSSGGPSEGTHEQKGCCSISVQDFKVAMELNPLQLGEDWPLLLEKMCQFI